MTWEAVATPHLNHRTILRDLRTLECVDCSVKLILPRDPNAGTPTPKPYRAPEQRTGRPMPSGWRQRVQAELDARKRQRTTVCDHDPDCEDVR